MKYVCTNCGSVATTINEAHPSVDDRYGVGHCDDCGPQKYKRHRDKMGKLVPTMQQVADGGTVEWRPVKIPRPTRPLIREDIYSRRLITERREAERRNKLMLAFADPAELPKGFKPTEEDRREGEALVRSFWEGDSA